MTCTYHLMSQSEETEMSHNPPRGVHGSCQGWGAGPTCFHFKVRVAMCTSGDIFSGYDWERSALASNG